jgi:hypothetical protein
MEDKFWISLPGGYREATREEWEAWIEEKDWVANGRRIARDEIPGGFVSTDMLWADHDFSFDKNHAPILWETMVYRNGQWGDCRRYTSREDAIAGHAAYVAEYLAGAAE